MGDWRSAFQSPFIYYVFLVCCQGWSVFFRKPLKNLPPFLDKGEFGMSYFVNWEKKRWVVVVPERLKRPRLRRVSGVEMRLTFSAQPRVIGKPMRAMIS